MKAGERNEVSPQYKKHPVKSSDATWRMCIHSKNNAYKEKSISQPKLLKKLII